MQLCASEANKTSAVGELAYHVFGSNAVQAASDSRTQQRRRYREGMQRKAEARTVPDIRDFSGTKAEKQSGNDTLQNSPEQAVPWPAGTPSLSTEPEWTRSAMRRCDLTSSSSRRSVISRLRSRSLPVYRPGDKRIMSRLHQKTGQGVNSSWGGACGFHWLDLLSLSPIGRRVY